VRLRAMHSTPIKLPPRGAGTSVLRRGNDRAKVDA
jgi:hypothetical protein